MDIVRDLTEALGAGVVADDATTLDRHRRDFTNVGPEPLAVAYPRSVEETSAILRRCHAVGQPVVPQGGMTGLAGGALASEGALALSVERMRTIEEVDPLGATMTVQAGVTLQAVQEAADAADMFFPLDLGGRGSAQVGGLISTNAGGNRVLRYGMMRDLVLGIEAVLPSGEVVSSLNKMMKNNTGYDLKQLFIGAEGTLGVVTRAVLKLFPKPRSTATALCALKDYDAVLQLLKRARAGLGGTLSAFEVMWPAFYRLGTQDLSGPPLPYGHGVYVLLDALGSDQEADQARFERVIGEAIEAGVVEDAVVAQSIRETRAMWAIRDCPGEFARLFWPQIPFDVSVPTAEIGRFVETGLHPRLTERWPGVEAIYFGHAADSNLHVSVKYSGRPEDAPPVKQVVYETVRDWKGSVSAEHGIGTEKKKYLGYSRSEAELALMRAVKAAIDPKGIMNPGKVL